MTEFVIEKPEHHKSLIVRIPEPRVHTNADTLEIFDILGYQVVAKKGNFKPGDLAIYIQPDSVVPQTEPFKWIWEEHIGLDGTVPARRRRITVKKLRTEASEGLLMPVLEFATEFGFAYPDTYEDSYYGWARRNPVGTDVSDLLGITHYEPEEDSPEGNTNAPKVKVARPRRPKTLKGWLRYFWYGVLHITGIRKQEGSQAIEVAFHSPHYDVAAMKAARNGFKDTDTVVITEKLHGSSARYVVLDGVQYIGSHFQWKAPDSKNIFTRAFEQNAWIGEWCKANPGRILYGEVVGDQSGFPYGTTEGRRDFYAFDILELDGTWTKPWNLSSPTIQVRTVPVLYVGLFSRMIANELAEEKKSKLDPKTTREGVVVSEAEPAQPGVRRPRQLKLVSSTYYAETSK